MARARKTVEVAAVRDRINNMIASSPDSYVAQREALALALECVLMDTGNYRGFSFLGSEYLPAEEQTLDNVLRDGYDGSRRRYS